MPIAVLIHLCSVATSPPSEAAHLLADQGSEVFFGLSLLAANITPPDLGIIPGRGLEFDGLSYAIVDKVQGFNSTSVTGVSVEFWIKVKEDPIGDGCLVSLATDTTNDLLSVCNPINLVVTKEQSSGATGLSAMDPLEKSSAEPNWYHIAVTWSHDGATLIFRNGLPLWAGSLGVGTHMRYSPTLVLGQKQNCKGGCFFKPGAKGFKGIMYEFRMWNFVRNKVDIHADLTHKMTGREDKLVVYLPLAEGMGLQATDLTINQNHAQFGLPAWDTQAPATGSRAALTFTGGQWIMNKTCAGFPTDALTVSLWIKSTEKEGTILSYATYMEPNMLLISNPGSLMLSRSSQLQNTAVDISDGAWHHIAMTWETGTLSLLQGSNTQNCQLFKDGGATAAWSGQLSAGAAMSSGGCLVLGQQQHFWSGGFQSTESFQGSLDHIYIWRTVRSAAQIASDMLLSSYAGTYMSLYWSMDEAVGRKVFDKGNSSNHGKMSGPEWMLECPNGCSSHGICGTSGYMRGRCICSRLWGGIDCSMGCPNNCSMHGDCIHGKCNCLPQYKGPGCDLFVGDLSTGCVIPGRRKFCSVMSYDVPAYLNTTQQDETAAFGFNTLSPYCPTAKGRKAMKYAICGQAFPKCVNGSALKPCRRMCQQYSKMCGGLSDAACMSYAYGDDPYCFNLTASGSMGCPNNCSNHGRCIDDEMMGTYCMCDKFWTGEDCSVAKNNCSKASKDLKFCNMVTYNVPLNFNQTMAEEVAHLAYSVAHPDCSINGVSNNEGLWAMQYVFCAAAFPKCNPATGEVKPPCLTMCWEYARRCGMDPGITCNTSRQFYYGDEPEDCFKLKLPGMDAFGSQFKPISNWQCPQNFSCTENGAHGACINGKCECVEGWTGEFCNIFLPECPNYCSNNGICRYGYCTCLPGWKGDDCSEQNNSPASTFSGVSLWGCGPTEDCSGHGDCQLGRTCICHEGYVGDFCDHALLDFIEASSHCPQDYQCSSHGQCHQGKCQCIAGWYGKDCFYEGKDFDWLRDQGKHGLKGISHSQH